MGTLDELRADDRGNRDLVRLAPGTFDPQKVTPLKLGSIWTSLLVVEAGGRRRTTADCR